MATADLQALPAPLRDRSRRTITLFVAALALFLIWIPRRFPQLIANGDLVVDGPLRAVEIAIACTVALVALVSATTRPTIPSVTSLLLVSAAASFWVAAAACQDLALMAVGWGGGWVLAGAAVARERSPIRLESGIKIHTLGAAAALILILGAALVSGLARTTNLSEVGFLLSRLPDSSVFALAAVRVLLVGCAFGAAWVPFHLWAPDGLSASPRPVATVLAVAAPLTAMLCLARIVYALEPTLRALPIHWQGGFFALAVLTVLLAGSVALVQKDAARLLAYLTVVQTAELLPAIVVSPERADTLVWAAAAHALALVPAWIAITAWSEADESAPLFDRLRGEGRRVPVRAFLLCFAFAAAAGIPGGIRFLSRPDVALVATPQVGWGLLFALSTAFQWAAVVRLIRALYLESPSTEARPIEWRPWSLSWVGVAVALGLQLLAVFWLVSKPELAPRWTNLLPGG